MSATGNRRAGVREEQPERDDACSRPEERSNPHRTTTKEDEQSARGPEREVDHVRYELERLLGEARTVQIVREEPDDPAGDADGEKRPSDD